METATPLSERDERYARVRREMARAGLDALLVGCKGHWWTGRGYGRYLSDFHLWGHDGLILLPLEGEPAMAVSSDTVARLVAERGWIADAGGDVLVLPRTVRSVRERGLDRGRIGTVGTPWIIPADLHRDLLAALPEARFEARDELLDRVRMVKSPLEVRQNREVWEIAKAAAVRFSEALAAGASQREVAAEAGRVALAGGARDLLALVGERGDRMAPPEDVPLRCDDLVRYHLEMSGPSGHWCELTITLAFRGPTAAESRLMESELRAMEAVRAAARPGARLARLAAAYEEALVADGWRLGAPSRHFDFHGQGMDVIELPWYAAEQPWGGSGDAGLEPGTVLSYHPRRDVAEAGGWPTGISDSLLVTADGGEWLSGDWSHRWREVRR